MVQEVFCVTCGQMQLLVVCAEIFKQQFDSRQRLYLHREIIQLEYVVCRMRLMIYKQIEEVAPRRALVGMRDVWRKHINLSSAKIDITFGKMKDRIPVPHIEQAYERRRDICVAPMV